MAVTIEAMIHPNICECWIHHKREVCDDGGWTHDYVLKLFILKLNELYSYAMLNLFGLYLTALYLIVRLPVAPD